MRYLMLVRVPEDAAPTPEESDPAPWHAEAVRRGQYLVGQRLRPPSDATTVHTWDGSVTVTHGPFAEVAEQIAGFDLLEVSSPEEAVEVAAGHPVARFGALELRRLWPHQEGADGWAPSDAETDGDLLPGESSFMLLMGSVPGAPTPHPEGHEEGLTTGQWIEEMGRRDVDRGGAPLRTADEAVTVRVREGRTLVTHGPYAEIAEQVAGYNLLHVEDLDEAIEVAGAHPAARHGVIEIRPLWPM